MFNNLKRMLGLMPSTEETDKKPNLHQSWVSWYRLKVYKRRKKRELLKYLVKQTAKFKTLDDYLYQLFANSRKERSETLDTYKAQHKVTDEALRDQINWMGDKMKEQSDAIVDAKALLTSQQAMIMNLESQYKDAVAGKTCIEAVLKRGIDYYDSTKLPYADQVTYMQRGQDVLKNETLQNEIRHLEADWIMYCAKDAPDFAAVRDMRMCMHGLDLLLDRLSKIPDPRKPVQEDDEFSAV